MLIVTREDRNITTGEAEDKYEDATKWEVDAHGGLRVKNRNNHSLAGYPAGRWLRVVADVGAADATS